MAASADTMAATNTLMVVGQQQVAKLARGEGCRVTGAARDGSRFACPHQNEHGPRFGERICGRQARQHCELGQLQVHGGKRHEVREMPVAEKPPTNGVRVASAAAARPPPARSLNYSAQAARLPLATTNYPALLELPLDARQRTGPKGFGRQSPYFLPPAHDAACCCSRLRLLATASAEPAMQQLQQPPPRAAEAPAVREPAAKRTVAAAGDRASPDEPGSGTGQVGHRQRRAGAITCTCSGRWLPPSRIARPRPAL